MKQLEITYVDPNDLVFADYNPRLISDESMANLEASLTKFGCVEPIVARESDRLIVGGHQRVGAAINLHWTKVPVIFIEASDEVCKAMNLALNSDRLRGTWDPEKLTNLLVELTPVLDAYPTGFSAIDIPTIQADAELNWAFEEAGLPELGSTNIEKQDLEFRSRPVVIRVEDVEEFYGLAEQFWGLTKKSSAEEWGEGLLNILRELGASNA